MSVGAVAIAEKPQSSLLRWWSSSADGRRVSIAVVVALGLWTVYYCVMKSRKATPVDRRGDPKKDKGGASEALRGPATPPSEGKAATPAAEVAALHQAAKRYDVEYQKRMEATAAALPSNVTAAPFIGFSLADNIIEGALVVDGVFEKGPADQVGVDIDHELHRIGGSKVRTLAEARAAVGRYCTPGKVSSMELSDEEGERYEVQLWVMTADPAYAGAPYYFNPADHSIRQSGRTKTVWGPSVVPPQS